MRTAATAASAAVGGVVLAACGRSTANAAGGAAGAATGVLPVPQSGVTQLTAMMNTQGSVAWNKTTQTLFQEFVDQHFNQNSQYKGLWLTCYPAGWGNASTQITDDIAGKGAADVWLFCCADIPTIEASGLAQPLDDLLRRDNIPVSLWSPGHIAADSYSGAVYGLPSYDGTLAIIYRQDVLDNLGLQYPDPTWSYQDAQNLWQSCTGKNAKGGKQAGVALYWSGVYEMIDWWLRGWGAREMSDNQTTATMATPQGAECFNYATQMFLDGVAINRGDPSQLTSGQAVFGQYHSALVVNAAQDLGTAFKWDFLPNPVWPAGRTTFVTIDGYMLNAESKNMDAAWEAMKWVNLGAPNGDGTYDYSWPKFQVQINLITPALLSLWDYWQTTVQVVAPPLKGKALNWWAEPSQKGYAYPTIFYKYQAVNATNIVDNWGAQIFAGKVSPTAGLQQMQQQINALEATSAAEIQAGAAVAKNFPVNGNAMAAVSTGV